MILVFALLLAKSGLLEVTPDMASDCQEFAHIHHFSFRPNAHNQDLQSVSTQGTQSSKNAECHEGKSVTLATPLPNPVIIEGPEIFAVIYELNFKERNNLQQLFISPLRKPPKILI